MKWLAPLLALAVALGCHTDGAFLRSADNAQFVDMAVGLAAAGFCMLHDAANDGKSKKPAQAEQPANDPNFVFVGNKPASEDGEHIGDSADGTSKADASDSLPPTPTFHSVFVGSYAYPIGLDKLPRGRRLRSTDD